MTVLEGCSCLITEQFPLTPTTRGNMLHLKTLFQKSCNRWRRKPIKVPHAAVFLEGWGLWLAPPGILRNTAQNLTWGQGMWSGWLNKRFKQEKDTVNLHTHTPTHTAFHWHVKNMLGGAFPEKHSFSFLFFFPFSFFAVFPRAMVRTALRIMLWVLDLLGNKNHHSVGTRNISLKTNKHLQSDTDYPVGTQCGSSPGQV